MGTVTLTASSNGSPLLTVKLSDVLASSDQVGSAGPTSGPTETVSLVYSKISITNNGPGGGTFCWDLKTLTACSGQ